MGVGVPVVLEEAEADAHEGEHEIKAEQVAVGELTAAPREAHADHPRLGTAEKAADIELEVEEVVQHHRHGDHERLADLLPHRNLVSDVVGVFTVWQVWGLTSTPLTPARMFMLLVQKVESMDM